MTAAELGKTDIIRNLMATAERNENPISPAKARKYAEQILRGKTPAEITNRPGTSRTIDYQDETGETAVRNVLAEQHGRKQAA